MTGKVIRKDNFPPTVNRKINIKYASSYSLYFVVKSFTKPPSVIVLLILHNDSYSFFSFKVLEETEYTLTEYEYRESRKLLLTGFSYLISSNEFILS